MKRQRLIVRSKTKAEDVSDPTHFPFVYTQQTSEFGTMDELLDYLNKMDFSWVIEVVIRTKEYSDLDA